MGEQYRARLAVYYGGLSHVHLHENQKTSMGTCYVHTLFGLSHLACESQSRVGRSVHGTTYVSDRMRDEKPFVQKSKRAGARGAHTASGQRRLGPGSASGQRRLLCTPI